MDGRPVGILCVNAGSSSLKLAVYEADRRIESGSVSRVGLANGLLTVRDDAGRTWRETPGRFPDVASALHAALDAIGIAAPAAVGHRVVFGGSAHVAPERVTPALVADLRAL